MSRPRRVVFFGTYDERHHPRVQVLREGLTAGGDAVEVVNVPFDLDTAARVRLVSQPWRAPLVAVRLALAWARLLFRSRRVRRPDAVVVGYLGHLDVHLARARWPRAHLVLDHLVSLADTTADRKLDKSPAVTRVLAAADRAAVARADTVVVDTAEQAAELPPADRRKAVVVPVGAPQRWFAASAGGAARRHADRPLSVVFFGLYTPLQGAAVIGDAIAKLAGEPVAWTMVGSGQDRAVCQAAAAPAADVRWLDWVEAADLPGLVAEHDVCLGIFGPGPKARRVVPNKVFQGAAAGCVIVTSDTPSQRDALGPAALYVSPGDAVALSEVLMNLADHPSEVESRKAATRDVAEARFTPAAVVSSLAARLREAADDGAPATTSAPLAPNAALRWHVVRRRVAEIAPGRILELGAGQGAIGARLAARAEYVGVEPDPVSRATLESRVPPAARVVTDIGELDDGEQFDMLCAFEVLEHIDDDDAALRSWVDRLRPGGHVLVSVPAGPERFGPADELAGHFRRHTPESLSALFAAAGLETVATEHYGFPLGVALEAGRNAIAKRRLAGQSAPDDIEARTAGSGRLLQPPGWAGTAIWAATAPFRLVEDRFPDRGPGLVGLARRPGAESRP